jgi:hypothetical protein
VAEYQHLGQKWGLNFFACDQADAFAKLESIRQTVRLEGELAYRVPASIEACASFVGTSS